MEIESLGDRLSLRLEKHGLLWRSVLPRLRTALECQNTNQIVNGGKHEYMNELLADSISVEVVKQAIMRKMGSYLEDRSEGRASHSELEKAMSDAIDTACPFAPGPQKKAAELAIPTEKKVKSSLVSSFVSKPSKSPLLDEDDTGMTHVEWRRTLHQMLYNSEETANSIRLEYSPVRITLGHDSGVDIGKLMRIN